MTKTDSTSHTHALTEIDKALASRGHYPQGCRRRARSPDCKAGGPPGHTPRRTPANRRQERHGDVGRLADLGPRRRCQRRDRRGEQHLRHHGRRFPGDELAVDRPPPHPPGHGPRCHAVRRHLRRRIWRRGHITFVDGACLQTWDGFVLAGGVVKETGSVVMGESGSPRTPRHHAAAVQGPRQRQGQRDDDSGFRHRPRRSTARGPSAGRITSPSRTGISTARAGWPRASTSTTPTPPTRAATTGLCAGSPSSGHSRRSSIGTRRAGTWCSKTARSPAAPGTP